MLYLNSLIINCNCLNILNGFPYESAVIYNYDHRYILKSYLETRYYKQKNNEFYKKILIHCEVCDCDENITELFIPDVYIKTNMTIEDHYHHNSNRFNISDDEI
jgi:hypothetical protein